MTHRFPIKEIAAQAGLGTATVDRVLNNRAHVAKPTRNRVMAAIRELKMQEAQLAAKGRRMFVDVVIEAPRRFSDEVKCAAEAVLESVSVAVFRPRFVMQEAMSDEELVATLDRIAKRGSQGVCLKARNVAAVRDAVERLQGLGIPVVTLVTDLPETGRATYVGVDNAQAGRVAGYLMAQALPQQSGVVFATRSRDAFFGEAERLQNFREVLTLQAPQLQLIDFAGGGGLAREMRESIDELIATHGAPLGVYSMGGGNEAILEALPRACREQVIYVAHDLDAENRKLLADGRLSFVLEHDLRQDMRNVFHSIAAHHGLMRPQPKVMASDVQVVTPFNVPVD